MGTACPPLNGRTLATFSQRGRPSLTRRDGFSVARLDGKVWVWQPVRFAKREEAEQWIAQRMAQDEFEAKTRTPELSDIWR